MSTKKGAQKHKNREAYKVDKWKKNDKKIVALKNMQVNYLLFKQNFEWIMSFFQANFPDFKRPVAGCFY